MESDDVTSYYDDTDTIYALSSGSLPKGQATAVAVVRISGPDASRILCELCRPNDDQKKIPPLPRIRYATVRKLYHPQTRQPLDQALILFFQAPSSFTGQDLVEIQCHGSRAVLDALLESLSYLHARLAEPGEFTQRAFGTGKLDLIQVEALADLLAADTAMQRQQALQQLDGTLSQLYAEWRQQLIAGLAHAEAVIDFGDDENLDVSTSSDTEIDPKNVAQQRVWGGVMERMQQLTTSMRRHLSDQRRGEMVREGVRIAIVGPPNAGKSSLFNLLAARDAAIVSAQAGTTRDILEVALNLGGIKCILQDTAGVRAETDDVIEREGIKRAVHAASQADLVVAMVDSNEAALGLKILESVLDKTHQSDENGDASVSKDHVLLIVNKADLKSENGGHNTSKEISTSSFQNRIGGTFEISCVTQQGIDSFLTDLTRRVSERVGGVEDHTPDSAFSDEGTVITRARHRQHVEAAVVALDRFDELSQQGSMAVDMAAEELRLAASELGRITGAVDVEDVLDKLFSDFCIGK